MNIADILRAHARETPGLPALVDGRRSVDFATLQKSVANLACKLRDTGVASGDLVLLEMRSNIAHVIAALALCRIGAIFCGSDWRQRPSERDAVRAGLRPRMTLADHALAESGGDRIVIPESWYSGEAAVPVAAVSGAAASSLILSSGTTGRPKAVILSHEAQAWRMVMRARDDGLRVGARVLHTLPLWTSAGISGLLAQLFAGATTYFLPLLFSPDDLIDALQRQRIDQVTLVPTVVRALLERSREGSTLLPDLESLTSLGSVFHAQDKQAALARVTPRIFERYGSVGTGVIARATPLDMTEAPDSVGPAPTFVRIEIVNDRGEAVAPGSVGRVRVSSPGNAQGYWADTGAEARGEIFADGYVYPGDLGSLGSDGRLYLQGRSISTIIRGGQNLQPEEVERVLLQHPSVADAAVLAIADLRLGEVPVAMVVGRAPVTIAELAGHCRAHLQSHKVPTAFRMVKGLPKNAGGKTDRAALSKWWAAAS